VYLGVSASGEQANTGYTVNVSVNNDTTNQIISSGTIANAVILPSTMYSLPSSVTVPAGQHFATFTLSIDELALKTYTGKMALLTVQLSNPTNYVLNTKYNQTVVVINVTALNLQ
jgi:predicted cupin superfamily sugar epimerase